jgi:uncharacterized protein (DUF2062 family)
MFQRRKPLTKLQHLRELFWPSMGWGRAIRYTRLRLIRMSDSTHRIALGIALGVAMSFNPLLGTHFIQAGLLAWLVGANIPCALIGTFAGNPWTFPFIWWGGIKFGAWVFHVLGLPASEQLPHHLDFEVLWHILRNQPLHLLLPWTIGGYLLGFMAMVPAYILSYRMVLAGKLARKKAKLYKIHKVAKEVTEDHHTG